MACAQPRAVAAKDAERAHLGLAPTRDERDQQIPLRRVDPAVGEAQEGHNGVDAGARFCRVHERGHAAQAYAREDQGAGNRRLEREPLFVGDLDRRYRPGNRAQHEEEGNNNEIARGHGELFENVCSGQRYDGGVRALPEGIACV